MSAVKGRITLQAEIKNKQLIVRFLTKRLNFLVIALLIVIAGGWVLSVTGSSSNELSQTSAAVVRSLRVNVLREIPHDINAFTQGLLWWNGKLYESTGQYASSTLRRINPKTGEVERNINIEPAYFAEGLARVDNRLLILTWKAERALVYDIQEFDFVRMLRYRGEGWGLCNDGARLVMSNGSNKLTFLDLQTFEATGSVSVTLRGQPQTQLNELECANGFVYANIWNQDYIVRIDPLSGRVTHQIDASKLLTQRESINADVLNGIAHNPNSDTFYITGKWWPKMFEVQFIE